MDSEQKMLKETELDLQIEQMRLTALQSEIMALSAVLHAEKFVEYKADLVEQMKKNLAKQQQIIDSWGRDKLNYELGKVL